MSWPRVDGASVSGGISSKHSIHGIQEGLPCPTTTDTGALHRALHSGYTTVQEQHLSRSSTTVAAPAGRSASLLRPPMIHKLGATKTDKQSIWRITAKNAQLLLVFNLLTAHNTNQALEELSGVKHCSYKYQVIVWENHSYPVSNSWKLLSQF